MRKKTEEEYYEKDTKRKKHSAMMIGSKSESLKETDPKMPQ